VKLFCCLAAVCVFASAVVVSSREAVAQEYRIKFATVAPEGSTWMKIMHEFDDAIKNESGGKLGFKIYAGGVQGEDKDVMRRIRGGQLHSAGFTGFGIGEISSKLRILDTPFLFKDHDEVDYLHKVFDTEFDLEFEENGFVLLGWAEVGLAYVFTNEPVRSSSDLKGVKMWMWEGDPVAEATFTALDVTPIPLSLVDVLTSLQTGLIDAAYATPLSALVLQWNTRVEYMTRVPLANVSGAVVVSKRKFDSIPPDLQEMLVRNGKKYMAELTRRSRLENDEAIGTLIRNGVKVVEVTSPATLKEYVDLGRKARKSLVGSLFDQKFLDRIEKTIADYRKEHSGSQ
jgi:TRAP-type C4-dicarboxylate transport system substrate-binding protein